MKQLMEEFANDFITLPYCIVKYCSHRYLQNERIRVHIVASLQVVALSEKEQLEPELTYAKIHYHPSSAIEINRKPQPKS